MSRLSEALRSEIEKTQTDKEITYQEVNGPDDAEKLIAPGFTAFHQILQTRMLVSLRKVYRRHAGEELPPTGEEYVNRTMDEMTAAFAHPLARSVSDGMLIGRDELFMVRKARASDDWSGLFKSESFKVQSEMYALGVLEDGDMQEMFRHDLRLAVEALSRGSGYHETDLGNESYLRKIWDLWLLAATSTSVAFYRAAYYVSKQWRETEILEGITVATEESADADTE